MTTQVERVAACFAQFDGDIDKIAKHVTSTPRGVKAAVKEAREQGLLPSEQTMVESTAAKQETKIKTLERELASIVKDNIDVANVRETIFGLANVAPSPPSWIVKSPRVGITGVPVVVWSDWHWGERVFKAQTGGVNEFDNAIAKARVTRLVDTTIELAMHHMVKPAYPGIIVCLGGDMITGNIHEELVATNEDPVAVSLLDVQEVLIAALTRIADVFGNVFVPCVVGNHGRNTLKMRAKNHTYESYEFILYCQLERHFRNDKRFRFLIPAETDAHFTVFGHRFMLTHGDTLGVKGGDGIIGALGPIARGTIKVGRSEAQIGRDFDTLLIGHWHTYIDGGEAVPVIVNGTLKGYDEYARLFLRARYSRPSQVMFFVHPKYGLTARWPIYLEPKLVSADSSEWLRWEQRKQEKV